MKPRNRPRPVADFWISYSDLMASLLLVFVLVLITALEHHARTVAERNRTIDEQHQALAVRAQQLEARRAELEILKRALDERDRELLERTARLSAATQSIDEKDRALAERERELAIAKAELAARDSALAERDTALAARDAELASRDAELARRSTLLEQTRAELALRASEVGKARSLLSAQRQRIDTLFGVRRSIVEALQARFPPGASGSSLTVDANTGAIRLGEGILFGENEATLRPDAGPVLQQFLDRYIGALLGSELFRKHVGQIVIEGHTNDNGPYLHNLELSQKRALSVMSFLLSTGSVDPASQATAPASAPAPARVLASSPILGDLQRLVTASGRSFSQPILLPDGSVDKVRSRRIEFKFRLKEDEMLREIEEALGPAAVDPATSAPPAVPATQ